MKVIEIEYPTPLSEVKDIENDNIDVFVTLEDRWHYTVVVGTPKSLLHYMEKEGKNYIEASPPDLIVKQLTHGNIVEVIERFAENDAYWLKLFAMAGTDEVCVVKS